MGRRSRYNRAWRHLVWVLATLYLAYRAIRRELRLAGMQSEFVAAVSHEFRTPITALTHLTDLLENGEPPAERRPLDIMRSHAKPDACAKWSRTSSTSDA